MLAEKLEIESSFLAFWKNQLTEQPRHKAQKNGVLKIYNCWATEEDHVIWSKAPERILNGNCGKIVLSTAVFKVNNELWVLKGKLFGDMVVGLGDMA